MKRLAFRSNMKKNTNCFIVFNSHTYFNEHFFLFYLFAANFHWYGSLLGLLVTLSIRIAADCVALFCQVIRKLKRATALEYTTILAIFLYIIKQRNYFFSLFSLINFKVYSKVYSLSISKSSIVGVTG